MEAIIGEIADLCKITSKRAVPALILVIKDKEEDTNVCWRVAWPY